MKKILLIALISVSIACKQKAKKKQVSTEAGLAQKEWIDLFDGVSFKGWHQFNGTEMSEAWIIAVSYTHLTLPTNREV